MILLAYFYCREQLRYCTHVLQVVSATMPPATSILYVVLRSIRRRHLQYSMMIVQYCTILNCTLILQRFEMFLWLFADSVT